MATRFYIYHDTTGKLHAANLKSYAGKLPTGWLEKKITAPSKYHTDWNPITRTLDDNGGGTPLTKDQLYADFVVEVKAAYANAGDQADIGLRNENIMAIINKASI